MFHQQTKSLWGKIKFSKLIWFYLLEKILLSTIICVPNYVASNYQKLITDLFFFVLYWFAPFLKFGPLPSENSRCAPGMQPRKFHFMLNYEAIISIIIVFSILKKEEDFLLRLTGRSYIIYKIYFQCNVTSNVTIFLLVSCLTLFKKCLQIQPSINRCCI